MSFSPMPAELLFSRGDKTDPRLGELAERLDGIKSVEDLRTKLAILGKDQRHLVIAGYPDDEGIRINGGRLGASSGPHEIRRWLYRMTPPLHSESLPIMHDLGDLRVADYDLKSRHQTASSFGATAMRAGATWIGLGGGHDYGYADASAFIAWCREQKERPLVINFDAHFDVRSTDKGLSSGTPFFRMFEDCADLDFAEIGIQSQCNSRSHLAWLKSRGARVLTQEELEFSGEPMATAVIRLLGDWLLKPRPAFLSVDIDAFSSAVAPGCSQSWATGFMPSDFFPLFQILCRRLDVRALGIYEVSPPLDQDGRTAKLAAQIIHRMLT